MRRSRWKRPNGSWWSPPTGRARTRSPGRMRSRRRFSPPRMPRRDTASARLPPGRYPVVLLIAESRESPTPDAGILDERVAAACLQIRDERVTAWEMGVQDGQHLHLAIGKL